MKQKLKLLIKSLSNRHRPGRDEDVFLFATPRGGSTWFMETIWTQPGFKYCSEPFDVRRPEIRMALGIETFAELYAKDACKKFEPYLRSIQNNHIAFHNPNPLRWNYRPFTNRIVFKVIHAGMDRIGWFEDIFSGRILVVLRHPIPVSLSRKDFPLLAQFDRCPLRENFSQEQVRFADRVRSSGTHLEKGVVAWCLHNALPLRSRRDSWVVVSYEEAVMNPVHVVEYMAEILSLPRPDKMLKASGQVSATSNQSTVERRKLLHDSDDRAKLINIWRNKVPETQESDLMGILDLFDIDAYLPGQDSISTKYRVITSGNLE